MHACVMIVLRVRLYKPRFPVCICPVPNKLMVSVDVKQHFTHCVYACKEKDHIYTLKILWSRSEFGGLWKHPNNSACTKSVRSLHNVEHKKKRRRARDDVYIIC